jgi:hypothetical protein
VVLETMQRLNSGWFEFTRQAAHIMKISAQNRVNLIKVTAYVEHVEAITNEELRDFLLGTICEFGGSPGYYSHVLKLLENVATQEDLVDHMNS